MTDSTIKPERITRPIQLLAAWLIGLVLVNGSFLSTAIALDEPIWLRAVLVVACVVNVPIFLGCLFQLQTKFRPQMQEDSFYAKFLEANTGEVVPKGSEDDAIEKLRQELSAWEARYVTLAAGLEVSLKNIAADVAKRQEALPNIEGTSPQKSEVAGELAASLSEVEHQLVQLSNLNYEVAINDLIPEYDSLVEDLEANSISIKRTFGSTSKVKEVPTRRVIGFGTGVSLDAVRRVVTVCEKYGFTEIHWASASINVNQIYVGSYVYRSRNSQPVPIAQVRDMLFDPSSTISKVIARITSIRRMQSAAGIPT